MDNTHLLSITAYDFQNTEDREKYIKWRDGAYAPMLVSSTPTAGVENYQILQEKAEYPFTFSIGYFQNLEDRLDVIRTPEYIAYQKDLEASWGSKYKYRWQTLYHVVKRLKNDKLIFDEHKDYTPENAPVILLYGAGLSTEEWEKYHIWFNEWGYPVYLPVLLKVPGVIEYSRWWLSNIRNRMPPKPNMSEDPKYPQDLSIIYFENLKAYQNFEKSREFAAFNKTLAAEFPNGLNYKWNVVYRLTGRWTK